MEWGVGRSSEVKDNLFAEQFSELTQRTKGEQGTGIGLKVCQELISLHQGSLTVDSTLGHGSVFSIHLPIKN